MANVSKIKLPDNSTLDIIDSRISSVDSSISSSSSGVVTNSTIAAEFDKVAYIGDTIDSVTYTDSGIVIDVSNKADKVTNATSGNFAALDANGNLTDSGHKSSDYQTTLISGTNIKTINNESLLGSGNITISAGGSGTVTSVGMTVPTGLSVSGSPITSNGTLAVSLASGYSIPTTSKQDEWDGKQAALVSGTNIKTVNNQSLLGSGNLNLSGTKVYEYSVTSFDSASITSALPNNFYLTLKDDIDNGLVPIIKLISTSNDEVALVFDMYYGSQKHLVFSSADKYYVCTLLVEYNKGSYNKYTYSEIQPQERLVSGTNIKTINNTSLLGSGNISIPSVWESGTGTTSVKVIDSLGTADGNYSTVEGKGCVTGGNYTENTLTADTADTSAGSYSHAEGRYTIANGSAGSHSEGNRTLASGQASHAEGNQTVSVGTASHAEGSRTIASSDGAHAEGRNTVAGAYAHAEGQMTFAEAMASHSEGRLGRALGQGSHVEGASSNIGIVINGNAGSLNYSATITNSVFAELYNSLGSSIFTQVIQNSSIAIQDNSNSARTITSVNNVTVSGDVISFTFTVDKTLSDSAVIDNDSYTLHFSQAAALSSHSESSVALGINSHAEGVSFAIGERSHSEGNITIALNENEHAEGRFNVSNKVSDTFGDAGNTQHSVGIGTTSARKNAIEIMQNGDAYLYGIGGYDGTNISQSDTLQDVIDAKQDTLWEAGSGTNSIQVANSRGGASGNYSTVEGEGCVTGGSYTENTLPTYTTDTSAGSYGHAEGRYTIASGSVGSHSEGNKTLASGGASHAEGNLTKASANYSHAEGNRTVASGAGSHSEGEATLAKGNNSHAEGMGSNAQGNYSHAECGNWWFTAVLTGGANATQYSAVIQDQEGVVVSLYNALGNETFSEVLLKSRVAITGKIPTTVTAITSVTNLSVINNSLNFSFTVEKTLSATALTNSDSGRLNMTMANGHNSHSESSISWGINSHAEGELTIAIGTHSHTEGKETISKNESEHAEGNFNLSNKASDTYGNAGNTQHSIGIGSASARKNAVEVMQNGDVYVYGVGGYNGTNYSSATTLQSAISNGGGGGGSTTDCVHKTGDESVGGDKTFTDNIAVVDASHILYSGSSPSQGFTRGYATASGDTGVIGFNNLSGEPKAFIVSPIGNITDVSGDTIIAVVGDSTGCHAVYTTGTQHNYMTTINASYSNGSLALDAGSTPTFFGDFNWQMVYYYGDGTLTFKTAQVQPGSGATTATFTGASLTEMPAFYAVMLESAVNNESYRRVAYYTNEGGGSSATPMGVSFYSSQIHNTTSSFSVSYNNGLYINSGGTNAGGYFHNPGTYTLYYLMASDIGGGGSGSYNSLKDELDEIRNTISGIETLLAAI